MGRWGRDILRRGSILGTPLVPRHWQLPFFFRGAGQQGCVDGSLSVTMLLEHRVLDVLFLQ